MAFLTKVDLDEFEARQRVRDEQLYAALHRIEQQLDDQGEALRSHGTMLGELTRLVTAVAAPRPSRAPAGRLTGTPPPTLACEEGSP